METRHPIWRAGRHLGQQMQACPVRLASMQGMSSSWEVTHPLHWEGVPELHHHNELLSVQLPRAALLMKK